MSTNPFPMNPIAIPGGDVLPFAGGRTVWRFDPLPEDASEAAAQDFARYVATLRALGHTVVVGDQGALALAAAQELAP